MFSDIVIIAAEQMHFAKSKTILDAIPKYMI